MASALTIRAVIECPHGAATTLSALVGLPLRQAAGGNLLTQTTVGSLPFPCTATLPCSAVVAWIPNQRTARLNGQLLLTTDSVPITNNGPGRVREAGQTIVKTGG